MVTKNNHTIIILVNIHCIYDTANTNTVNGGIKKLSKKLEKLIKAFPHASFLQTDENKKLFMKQGRHHNRL
jgi:predicted amidohydrolase YtcJ